MFDIFEFIELFDIELLVFMFEFIGVIGVETAAGVDAVLLTVMFEFLLVFDVVLLPEVSPQAIISIPAGKSRAQPIILRIFKSP